MEKRRRLRSRALLLAVVVSIGCASAPPRPLRAPDPAPRSPLRNSATGAVAARTALSMIGVPYRYGGRTPSGFDCSGLVVYSYTRAGIDHLPRTTADLQRAAMPVRLDRLEPGDLLFFQLNGKKTSHVGLYVGDRSFVHAPSSGKRVEKVSFDHVYWGPRIRLAGRLRP